jgi:hypothetical protein
MSDARPFFGGHRDAVTNQVFSDNVNRSAGTARRFKDGTVVPASKKSIVKKPKQLAGGLSVPGTGTLCRMTPLQRAEWMHQQQHEFWPLEREKFQHSSETQQDVEAYLELHEWKRLAYDAAGEDLDSDWYLSSSKHVRKALTTCGKQPRLVASYQGTGSRTTHGGVEFFTHSDGSIALIRCDPGVQCRCGEWHPKRI